MSAYVKNSQQDWLPGSSLYPAFLSNIGTIDCYETADVPRKAIPASSANYKGEAYWLGAGGSVRIGDWSPNRVALDVDAAGEGYLVLNQNYDPGWHLAEGAGRQVEEMDGLLAVKVAPSDKRIVLYYLPTSFIVGLAVTLAASLAGLILSAGRGRVRFLGG